MIQTVLYNAHVALGAKMVEFGGFAMPIQYKGILSEHEACRNGAVIFDTCHMGEFYIKGASALSDLEKIISSPLADMPHYSCRYGYILNESGGVIDDQIIYRFSDESFMMVVNASTAQGDAAWIQKHLSDTTSFENASDRTAKIDLQGPLSAKICAKISSKPLNNLSYYTFVESSWNNTPVLISRTGYTGEIGFELYCDTAHAEKLWTTLLELGAIPAGLGARDTLRLEMGYPLYGHELNATRNAQWAGFSKAIAHTKNFIGSSAVHNVENFGTTLVGLILNDRRAGRDHDAITDSLGAVIGEVTSGSFSPSLGKGIALGYVTCASATPGTVVNIVTSRQSLGATVSLLPLFKNATGRKKLVEFL